MTIDRDEAKTLARELVLEIFNQLGIDINDPRSVERFRKNMMFVNRQREGAEEMGSFIKKSAVWIVIVSAATALWYGIKVALGQ